MLNSGFQPLTNLIFRYFSTDTTVGVKALLVG